MKSPVYIEMKYVQKGGLDFEIDPCDTMPGPDGTIRGFALNQTCSCNNCDKSCNLKDVSTEFPVFEGFNPLVVGIYYFIVILLTAIIYVCKCYYRKKNPDHNSRSSSIDSDNFGSQNEITNNTQSITNITKNNINNNNLDFNKDK
jgi:hypothetical protein